MKLSIVTTLYYSAPYLDEFYQRISAEAKGITDDYEIIFVNDGSPDDSLVRAISLFNQDRHVVILDLSRNYGHHKAMMTGLAHAKGDLVFLIDCDLEEEPERLGEFAIKLHESQADVVYGVQEKRKGKYLEKITGMAFYWLYNLLSNYPIPSNVLTIRLMTNRYVKGLIEHQDQEIFLAGLWAITGFTQVPVAIKKYDKGQSTYDIRKKVALFVNSVTSFSNKPLVLIFYLGICLIMISGVAASYLIVRRIFFGIFLAGWPSLIVSVWLLGGISIFCMGIIGIYLSKIFTETKRRPYTIIRNIYSRDLADADR